jgi:membrane-bound ClpP family serine protease
MITTTQMYWIVTLDSIVTVSIVLTIGGIFLTLFSMAAACDNEVPFGVPIVIASISAFFILVATFVPSTKQMAAILIVPRIANSEKVQTVGNKIYDLASEWMDELRPNAAKNKENEK